MYTQTCQFTFVVILRYRGVYYVFTFGQLFLLMYPPPLWGAALALGKCTAYPHSNTTTLTWVTGSAASCDVCVPCHTCYTPWASAGAGPFGATTPGASVGCCSLSPCGRGCTAYPPHVPHPPPAVSSSSECARGGSDGRQAAAGGALRMCLQKASLVCAGVPWRLEDIIHPFRIGALSIHILPG